MKDLEQKLNDALEPLIGQPVSSATPAMIMPAIRKLMPSVIAQDIVSVQPMTSPNGLVFDIKYEAPKSFVRVDASKDGLPLPPEGYIAVDVNWEVARWISEQPIHMWKFRDAPAYSPVMERYTISEKLYTLMAVRFE